MTNVAGVRLLAATSPRRQHHAAPPAATSTRPHTLPTNATGPTLRAYCTIAAEAVLPPSSNAPRRHSREPGGAVVFLSHAHSRVRPLCKQPAGHGCLLISPLQPPLAKYRRARTFRFEDPKMQMKVSIMPASHWPENDFARKSPRQGALLAANLTRIHRS